MEDQKEGHTVFEFQAISVPVKLPVNKMQND